MPAGKRKHPRPATKLYVLTEPQQIFVKEYLSNMGNATAAYRVAYPDKAVSEHNVGSLASATRRAKGVDAAITEAHNLALSAQRAVVNRYVSGQEKVAEELAKLAFSELTQVVEWSGGHLTLRDAGAIDPRAQAAIAEVVEGKDGLKVKMHDKRQALMDLAKLMGWIVDKSQVQTDQQHTFVLKVER